jgi:shikimate dehydrogenase
LSKEAFPNQNTVLCISLASSPSNFGMTVHNAAYRTMGLNFLYKAFGTSDLPGALQGVRALGIRGCSVSMPFKEAAIPLVDALDPNAEAIGAINTIVNDAGRLTGYNTDAHGAHVVISRLDIPRSSRVLILGAGGVAHSIMYALSSLGYTDITITNRSPERLNAWSGRETFSVSRWQNRESVKADFIINATSIGMVPEEADMPVSVEMISKAKAVMDVTVARSDSLLIRTAKAQQKAVVCGYEMSLYQAARQFELYTQREAPIVEMERSLRGFFGMAP